MPEQKQVEKQSPTLQSVVYYFFLLMLGCAFCEPITSSLIYFHVIVGDWIRANGVVPTQNLWSNTGFGTEWLSQSWLFDVVVSYVAGFSLEPMRPLSLAVFKLGLSIVFVASCGALFSHASGSRFIGALLAAMASSSVLLSGIFSDASIGWLFFALYLAQVLKFKESPERKELLKLAAIGLLYVNCHISAYAAFLSGALILLPFCGEARQRSSVVFALFAPIFMTPYLGAQAVAALSVFSSDFFLSMGMQANPSTVFHYQFSFLLLAWLIAGVGYFVARKPIYRDELLLGLFFTVFALAWAAYLPYATLSVLLLIGLLWREGDGKNYGQLGESLRLLRARCGRWELPGIIFVLFCLAVVSAAQLYKFPRVGTIPTQALALMEERGVKGPLIHDLTASGYVLQHFSDGKGESRVLPAYDLRVANLDWEAAVEVLRFELRGLDGDKLFQRISPQAAIALTETPLYQQLIVRADWELIYEWGVRLGEEKLPPPEQRRGKSWALFLKR